MGTAACHKTVMLIASVIYRDEKYRDLAVKLLVKRYGAFHFPAWQGPFDYTEYYCKEMGKPLNRCFYAFKKLVSPEDIYKTKLYSNAIERKYTKLGRRNVNVDPGYLSEAKLSLLTTKDYVHRIYLRSGIFAENTLQFKAGSFDTWPWTYPDYGQEEIRKYFNMLREIYRCESGMRR
ncbi:MAG: DUF4416 family protein [Candidatus Omnitrophica bacterium]|nr:DUF4416 family protein [Candidatus Omnitrophota bacterium]